MWSAYEKQRLENALNAGKSILEISATLHKSPNAIESFMRRHNIFNPNNKKRRWTEKEDESLKTLFAQGMQDKHIARELNRCPTAVTQRRKKLKLRSYRPSTKTPPEIRCDIKFSVNKSVKITLDNLARENKQTLSLYLRRLILSTLP